METNNTDTRKAALLWWNGLDERQKIGAIATELKITLNKAGELWDYWQGGITDDKIEEIYTTCHALANPSPTAAIEGKKEVGEGWVIKNNTHIGIVKSIKTTDGGTANVFRPIAKTIQEITYKHGEAEANAQRIVMAVNNFDGLVAIAKRAAFLFGNEANYPEGTIGYNIAQDAKNILNNINNLKP